MLDPDVIAELADRYANGETLQSLAERYQANYSSVRDALIGAKVEMRPPGILLPATPPGLVNAYNDGQTIHQVAAKYGMSYGQTRRILLAEGVQLRPPGKSGSDRTARTTGRV